LRSLKKASLSRLAWPMVRRSGNAFQIFSSFTFPFPTIVAYRRAPPAADDVLRRRAASKRQITEWTSLLKSDDAQKRSSAATSLLSAESDAAMSALMGALDPKQPKNMRISVITAFGVRGDDRAAKQIVLAVGDQDQEVREAAAAALLSINSPDAIQALVEAADDDKRPGQTRVQIIGILGEMRSMEAIAPLISLLADPDENIRKNSRAALERITLRTFDTPQGWAEWWKHSSTLSRAEMLAEFGDATGPEARRPDAEAREPSAAGNS